jgi:transposase InsO family protein
MRKDGIRARQARKFKVTTDSEHRFPVAGNELDRNFDADVPNARWCGDITYIWTSEGWLYLAVVLDLFSRRIVGWHVKKTLGRGLVIEALKGALRTRRPDEGLLHHSDRGSQYASGDYQELLTGAGCRVSMSRKGNCWDNAPAESFFATLKKELVYGRRFATREEARGELFEFIEIWYNRKRLHSSLGYLSPAQYEEKMLMQSTAIAA